MVVTRERLRNVGRRCAGFDQKLAICAKHDEVFLVVAPDQDKTPFGINGQDFNDREAATAATFRTTASGTFRQGGAWREPETFGEQRNATD